MRGVARSYERVAWCYEALARAWSLGAIPAARRLNTARLRPGERVLFAGVGTGADALQAAARGARVTGVDVSPAMLRRVSRRFARSGRPVELWRGDVRELEGRWDAVVAHFFLNVFAPDELGDAIDALVARLEPGGRLLVADFAPAAGGRAARWAAVANFAPVCRLASALELCAPHPLYDYGPLLRARGLELRARTRTRVAGVGPAWYEALEAVRPA